MQCDCNKTINLLKTAGGQIDGIINMIEDDRYCIDVITQIMATQAILFWRLIKKIGCPII